MLSDRHHPGFVQQDWKGIGSYGTVGLEFALSILFGAWIGNWLDKKTGFYPWLTIIFGACGLAAGVRALWRVAQQANREADRQERMEREARKKYHDDSQRPQP